jgi:hypothetical protein
MRRFEPLILCFACAGLILGCATMSKNDCLEADWHRVGYTDGRMGAPRARLQLHTEACTGHGVQPDRTAYYRGREEGLAVYCTEANGFEQGRLGRQYRNVCPPEVEPVFVAAYRRGLEVRQHDLDVERLEKRLTAIEKEIERKEKMVYTGNISREERAELGREIRELELEQREVALELKELAMSQPPEFATVYEPH